MTAQVLGVLVFLIDQGVYTDSRSVPWLLDFLINVIDGKSDQGNGMLLFYMYLHIELCIDIHVSHNHGAGYRIVVKVKIL